MIHQAFYDAASIFHSSLISHHFPLGATPYILLVPFLMVSLHIPTLKCPTVTSSLDWLFFILHHPAPSPSPLGSIKLTPQLGLSGFVLCSTTMLCKFLRALNICLWVSGSFLFKRTSLKKAGASTY